MGQHDLRAHPLAIVDLSGLGGLIVSVAHVVTVPTDQHGSG
jgi:hypothetical protein